MLDNVILMPVSIYTTGNQLSATAKTSLAELANKLPEDYKKRLFPVRVQKSQIAKISNIQ